MRDIVVVNSARDRRWFAAFSFVVVLTTLCVVVTVAVAAGDLIGGELVLVLVLWLAYDLWLKWYGGHDADRQWPNALVSLGAAFGLLFTVYSATLLTADLRGTKVNTTVDGLNTMIGVVILAVAVGVELYRRERDKARVVTG